VNGNTGYQTKTCYERRTSLKPRFQKQIVNFSTVSLFKSLGDYLLKGSIGVEKGCSENGLFVWRQ
jgi:hypothetical protein